MASASFRCALLSFFKHNAHKAESDTTAYIGTFTIICQKSFYMAPQAAEILSPRSKCTLYPSDSTRSSAAGETDCSQNWQMIQATRGWSCHRSQQDSLLHSPVRPGDGQIGVWAEAKTVLCSGGLMYSQKRVLWVEWWMFSFVRSDAVAQGCIPFMWSCFDVHFLTRVLCDSACISWLVIKTWTVFKCRVRLTESGSRVHATHVLSTRGRQRPMQKPFDNDSPCLKNVLQPTYFQIFALCSTLDVRLCTIKYEKKVLDHQSKYFAVCLQRPPAKTLDFTILLKVILFTFVARWVMWRYGEPQWFLGSSLVVLVVKYANGIILLY